VVEIASRASLNFHRQEARAQVGMKNGRCPNLKLKKWVKYRCYHNMDK